MSMWGRGKAWFLSLSKGAVPLHIMFNAYALCSHRLFSESRHLGIEARRAEMFVE
jgi:hypothetical protein